jgi:hypothetical protein
LKSERLTAGTLADSSRRAKAIRAMAATMAQAVMTRESNQESRSPSSRKYCRAERPTERSAMPCQSMFFFCSAAALRLAARTSSGSWTKRQTMKRPSAPTGRLM